MHLKTFGWRHCLLTHIMAPVLSAMHFILNLIFVYVGVPSVLVWKILCSKRTWLTSSLLLNGLNGLLRIIGWGRISAIICLNVHQIWTKFLLLSQISRISIKASFYVLLIGNFVSMKRKTPVQKIIYFLVNDQLYIWQALGGINPSKTGKLEQLTKVIY